MTMASDGTKLTGLLFDGQRYYASHLRSVTTLDDTLTVFSTTRRWLDIYFNDGIPDFTPDLMLPESDFRRVVTKIMMEVPYGATTTYGEIARKVATRLGVKHMSAQAVGGAVGHNAISLIIPCNRVLGANGQLTGYAGGLDKKKYMLQMEHKNIYN